MNSLGQLWRAATARITQPFRSRVQPEARTVEHDADRGSNIIQLERVRDELTAVSKAETNRLAGLERQLAELEAKHDATGTWMQELEVTLANTRTELEHTHNQIRVLEQQIDEGQQLYLKSVQETQLQIRKQDMRLSWLMLVSGLAVILAVVASAILVWDVRKNADLLAGMSSDIRQLAASIQQQAHNSPPGLPATGAVDKPDMPTTAPVQPARKAQSGAVPALPLPETHDSSASGQAGMDTDTQTENQPGPGAGDGDAVKDEIRRFFERNARVPDMVSLPSGVQYRVVKQGSGKTPTLKDWVVVDYIGMTRDGSIFDNTYDTGQRAIFGIDGLPPAWQEPLLQMHEGSEFELYVPPGNANIGGVPSPDKPEQEPGIYLIELVHVVEAGSDG